MGVIDLDARVKKLEQGGGGMDPAVIDQLEAAVTALEDAAEYSESEHVVGKWIDGNDLYEQTLALDWSDMVDPSVTSSEINGKIYTDLDADTVDIWIENAFMSYRGTDADISIQSCPLNYSTADKFVRLNIQHKATENSGKPYLYLDITYPGDILGTGKQDGWVFIITIRYTKPSAT